MKKVLFWLILLSISVSAQQTSPTPVLYSSDTLADLKKIQKTALKSDYAYKQTAYMTNNIGPRLSGSKQADRAVEYVAAEMRKLGLDVQLQELKVPHWERGIETAELVQFEGMAKGTTQKIVLTTLGGSVATPESGLIADVVVVENFDELKKLERENIEGKIVVYNNKFDQRMAKVGYGLEAYGVAGAYRRSGAIEAAKFGAVASIVRSIGSSQNRLPHTGGMGYDKDVKKIPGAAVAYEDGEILAYLAKMGKVRMKLVLTPKTYPDATSYNVIADLKGSEKPNEIVLVSGHLDSWDLGTGALDDAVGVAMAMQVPYLLKKLKLKPKRTVRVVAFMNEENGFVGARTYADKADISKHFAAIESDLGASHPIGFLYSGKQEGMGYFHALTNILNNQGAVGVRRQPTVSSDITRLTIMGVPSFAPWYDTRSYFNYHHNAADTLDKVNPEELAENASLMAVLAYGLANLEQPLPR